MSVGQVLGQLACIWLAPIVGYRSMVYMGRDEATCRKAGLVGVAVSVVASIVLFSVVLWRL